jgi:hypothetical protein
MDIYVKERSNLRISYGNIGNSNERLEMGFNVVAITKADFSETKPIKCFEGLFDSQLKRQCATTACALYLLGALWIELIDKKKIVNYTTTTSSNIWVLSYP